MDCFALAGHGRIWQTLQQNVDHCTWPKMERSSDNFVTTFSAFKMKQVCMYLLNILQLSVYNKTFRYTRLKKEGKNEQERR